MAKQQAITINVTKSITEANDTFARENRNVFKTKGILAINIISAPGSGKTTLLEKTIPALLPDYESVVIVGDLETARDAERLAPYARAVTQISTGFSCHLYANQVTDSIRQMRLDAADFLFIENVGNMVCPGEFDLGENLKVILYSIPEGDDKVAKYPTIFRAADLVLLTKIDLLHLLPFEIERVRSDLKIINENVPVIEVSQFSGEGMHEWLTWLKKQRTQAIGLTAKAVKGED